MEATECCDIYCTTCRIWYLKILRPGDTVPFKKPNHILPLGVVEIMTASVIIVLDVLALFCQGKGLAAPAPSFLGSPAFPLWLSVLFVFCGCVNVSTHKHKTRFTTAICFGVSIIATVLVVTLLAVMMMAIAQEINYYHQSLAASGAVISCVISALVLVLFVATSSTSLLCYLALTSHDDRWFTDRGTQHDSPETLDGRSGNATLSVPSGTPAFLFYAPSREAAKYTSVFSDVMGGIETKKHKSDLATEDDEENDSADGRNTEDFNNVELATRDHSPSMEPAGAS